MKQATDKKRLTFLRSLSPQTRQWLWFAALWLCGFAVVGAISLLVKLIVSFA